MRRSGLRGRLTQGVCVCVDVRREYGVLYREAFKKAHVAYCIEQLFRKHEQRSFVRRIEA